MPLMIMSKALELTVVKKQFKKFHTASYAQLQLVNLRRQGIAHCKVKRAELFEVFRGKEGVQNLDPVEGIIPAFTFNLFISTPQSSGFGNKSSKELDCLP